MDTTTINNKFEFQGFTFSNGEIRGFGGAGPIVAHMSPTVAENSFRFWVLGYKAAYNDLKTLFAGNGF